MNDRPERYIYKGLVVPKTCGLCGNKLYEWQYKRAYIGAVVHQDCTRENAELEKRELAEKFGTARVESFDTGEHDWKRSIGESLEEPSDTPPRKMQKVPTDEVDPVDNLAESLDKLPSATRTFDTGATRDTDAGKLDFEAFLSPAVLVRYAEHLHKHAKQSDGKMRPGDNWQKGIPRSAYMKSMFRHFMAAWSKHRSTGVYATADLEEDLCGVMFNAMGYLFEVLKENDE